MSEHGYPSIRASYTIQVDEQGYRCYRGALRRYADKTVIWQCGHLHYARGFYSDGAQACANQEHWRRSRAAAAQAEQNGASR